MVPAPGRVIDEWVDFAGGFLRSSSWLAAGGSDSAIAVALQNVSNALLQFQTAANPIIGTLTATDALYGSVQDVAQLVFATIPGSQIQVVVPAPLASMFGAGGLTVDPTDPGTAALIAAVLANLTDIAGNPATGYVSGQKGSRRREQL